MRISDWSSDVCSSDLKVRLILTYPPSTGRNFAEVIRAIDSLQLTDAQSVATPVNWEQGEEVIISPKLSDEDAHARFPQGFRTLTPYLRSVDLNQSAYTGQPSARGEDWQLAPLFPTALRGKDATHEFDRIQPPSPPHSARPAIPG